LERYTAGNNAFPQLGADRCNSSRSNMAAVVWVMTLSKEHFDNFIITFLISITTGRTFSKTTTDGYAKRWQL